MLAPSAFPKWLPPVAAQEAQRILDAEGTNTALVLRLALDERMRPVWNELTKCKTTHPHISDTWATLMSGRVDVPPPQDSDALTLFFWCAYTIASLEPEVGTVSLCDLPIAQYQHVAARLRWSVAALRQLKLKYGEIVQDGVQFSDIHADGIKDAVEFCEENIATLSQLKAAQAPLVVGRNHGKREERGYVRMLAPEMQRLFGMKAPWRSLARVASVALMKTVTDVQARKWCDTLDKG